MDLEHKTLETESQYSDQIPTFNCQKTYGEKSWSDTGYASTITTEGTKITKRTGCVRNGSRYLWSIGWDVKSSKSYQIPVDLSKHSEAL